MGLEKITVSIIIIIRMRIFFCKSILEVALRAGYNFDVTVHEFMLISICQCLSIFVSSLALLFSVQFSIKFYFLSM